MLNVKIVNGECEEMDFEGNGMEIMNELEFVVGNVLYNMIEQGGFDKEDLGDILETFANNVEVAVETIEKHADRFRKLC